MYGLASRESLSKRQSRWVRDVDESVRSNPAQRAINHEHSSHPIRDKHNIISLTPPGLLDLMDDQSHWESPSNHHNEIIGPTDSSFSLASGHNPLLRKNQDHPSNRSALHEVITELQQQYSKLEQECEFLKNSLSTCSDLSVRVNRIEQQNPITRLEHNNDISALITKVASLEQSMSELSHRTENSSQVIPVRNYTQPIDNSSEFSAPTDPEILTNKYREFVPFFIKEQYAGRDNRTILTDMRMDMLVDIVGLFDEPPIIYPFGVTKDFPHFAELTLDMVFVDADKYVNGTVYGVFSRRPDGVYTIKITELYSDGEASGIEKFTLPLTITCNTELILE